MRFSRLVLTKSNVFWPVLWMLACASPGLAKSDYRELVAPDTVQHDLKGAVKSLNEKTYRVGDDGRRALQQEKIVHFDREGYQSVELTVNAISPVGNTEIRVYDENLNWVRQETGHGTNLEIRQVETDPVKKQVTWRRTDAAGKPLVAKEVIYDSHRKVSEGREFDNKGALAESYRVTRNDRGLGTELLFLGATGKVEYRTVPSWDSRGFMTGSVDELVGSKSTTIWKIEPVTVDAAGNWTELRKSAKYKGKDGTHSGPKEAVVRVIEYYPETPAQ